MIVECVKENSYGFQVGKKYWADDFPTNVENLIKVHGVYNGGVVTYFSKKDFDATFCKVHSYSQEIKKKAVVSEETAVVLIGIFILVLVLMFSGK